MIYKHHFFNLDTKTKKVFDENSKELYVTGNSYRMLLFLCENDGGNVTEIGEYLDEAKDYDENHLRQYRYKINSIIGHNIIEYRNGIYSIDGELKKAEKSNPGSSSDNGSLHQQNAKIEKVVVPFTTIPAITSLVIILFSFLHMPYGYYMMLRIVLTATSIYYVYYFYSFTVKKIGFWFWTFLIMAIVFNPIIPVYLYSRSVWAVIDIITSLFLVTLCIIPSKKKI